MYFLVIVKSDGSDFFLRGGGGCHRLAPAGAFKALKIVNPLRAKEENENEIKVI